jgi:hypothetical protein
VHKYELSASQFAEMYRGEIHTLLKSVSEFSSVFYTSTSRGFEIHCERSEFNTVDLL